MSAKNLGDKIQRVKVELGAIGGGKSPWTQGVEVITVGRASARSEVGSAEVPAVAQAPFS